MLFKRSDGRACNHVRPIIIKYDSFGYADASVLYSIGRTKVLISVSLQDGVPKFLRGQKIGWLTSEYAMLPCATHKRTNRESSQVYKSSRSVEISRLIGRCLRTVTDLKLLGEKSILIDCDVLQADGGTRVACITAASLALSLANKRWLKRNIIEKNIIKESIAAVSAGKIKDNFLLDLNCEEDNRTDVDFNFVLTKSGKLIEIQGTSEKKPLDWKDFDLLKNLAEEGIKKIFLESENVSKNTKIDFVRKNQRQQKKAPLFSLANRLNITTLKN